MSRWFAINDAAVQAAASERTARGKGGSTVRVFKTERARDAARGGLSATEKTVGEIVYRCKFEIADALYAYCDAVFPDHRIPVDLIDTF